MQDTEIDEGDWPRLAATMGRSEYLSASSVDVDLARGLDRLVPGLVELAGQWRADTDRLLLVGSGGSFAALLTAQYILESQVAIPVTVIPAKEVAWRAPVWVGRRTAVVLVSYSGETGDVLAAQEYLQLRQPRTIAIVGRPGSTLARRCDASFTYPGAVIYETPIALTVAFATHLAGDGPAWTERLTRFAATMPAVVEHSSTRMRQLAVRLAEVDHLYVVGSGPQSSLAFKLAGVLMENVRIGASFVDGSEFRHGPMEVLADRPVTVLGLLGLDGSRLMTDNVLRFVEVQGGRVETIDAADLPVTDELLAPLALNPWTQWFVAWSAAVRGIRDLDERVYMGKVVLAG